MTISLRPHQKTCLNAMWKNDKGQIIVPTGGGKTYIMIADFMKELQVRKAHTTVVVAPRILLANQLCSDFFEHNLDNNHNLSIQCMHVHSGETGHYSTTKAKDIMMWHLMSNVNEARIIFTTYHSLHRIVESNIPVDTIYFDEAHNSTGKNFFNAVKTISKRIDNNCGSAYFFTATPRYGRGKSEERGMQNTKVYGHEIAKVSAKELIDNGIILPPKIVPFDSNLNRNKVNAHEVDASNLKSILTDTIEDDSKVLVSAPSTRVLMNMLSKTDILEWFKENGFDVLHITSKYGAVINGKKVGRDKFFDTLNEWGHTDRKFVVFHYSILSEGINVSGLTHTVLLRNLPVIEMAQTIGRVIRIHHDDRKSVADGIIPVAQYSLYRKSYGNVTVPLCGKHGQKIADRLNNVVNQIFVEGNPPIAWAS